MRRFSNGSQEAAQYDSLGRCLFKCTRFRNGVWTRRYHWSGEGELRRVEDSRRGETVHHYDAAHRLRRRILPDGSVEEFDLDAADNLLSQPGLISTLEDGNRLASIGGRRVAYNDRNHIAERELSSGTVRYRYDSRDHLTKIASERGDWTAEYDALGRRTRKTSGGQTTEFYWYIDQLIAEVSPTGKLRIYVYADPLAMSPVLFLDYDSIDASPQSARRYFIHADQIGVPLLIEDRAGEVVWRAGIDPYGHAHVSANAGIECNLRFPGHYFDSETSLHYNRFRYYDPTLGRFMQSDPWGIAGGYNLYAYCRNPLLDVDVRGRGGDEDCAPKPGEDDGEQTARQRREAMQALEDLGLINKPPNAPNIENWISKGGTVNLNDDGSMTYTRADGVSVTYRNGYPDFSSFETHPSGVTSVQIAQSTNRDADFRAANIAAGHPEWGDGPPSSDWTWHHNEDGTTMQLVPRDVHSDFTHAGGVSQQNN
jgi:RHS repeat-associated protein